MYSVLLMAALSNGAATPAWQDTSGPGMQRSYADHGHREYRGRRGGCCGCWGGCYGGWGGCWGGGGYGCYGGCRGGGYGCYGGGWGGYGRGYAGRSYYEGPYSGMPVYGGSYYSSSEGNTYPQAAEGMAPATLVVHLPASARLTVDDTPTRSISETRQFITPPLDRDKQFHYELKAEMNRDGRPVTVTKRVAVRGGETTDVRLDMPERTTSRR